MEPVLVVGAGPTGLVTALSLARRGVPVRIIDEKDGPARESRAMGLHARSLEYYRQFGFGDAVVERGVVADAIAFRAGNRDVTRFSLADMGSGLSPYPFLLAFPQDEHERFLLDRLGDLGVAVQWGVSLTDVADVGDQVEAVLTSGDGTERVTHPYVIGCDGAHSRVRDVLGIGFPGGSSDQLFYVADAVVPGIGHNSIYFGFREAGLALMMPVRSTGTQRLMGFAPPEARSKVDVRFDDVRDHVESLLGIDVGDVNWFSTYRVHHRVAESFRRGRIFIAGDAGHIHSPAGGQGMNTGIGDAVNLSWKIAEVLHRRADAAILETYEAERLPFARSLIATTDRVFKFLVDDGKLAQIARVHIAPQVIAAVARFAASRRQIFKTVSQTRLSYRGCAFNQGRAGAIRGGDRLPWVTFPGGDNFTALQSLSWQLHVYGEPEPAIVTTADEVAIDLRRFDFGDTAERAGLQRDAAYLVRPDGYVALASAPGNAPELTNFVKRWGLHPGQSRRPSGKAHHD